MDAKSAGKPNPTPQRAEITYYLPDEVILHLEHAADLPVDQLQKDLEIFFDRMKATLPWVEELEALQAESFLTFRVPGEETALSSVPVLLKERRELNVLLVEIFDQNRKVFKNGRVEISAAGGMPVVLSGVSPNWLAGGAPHGIGVASPGGWPEEANEPQANQKRLKLKGKKEGVINLEDSTGQGSDVQVYILDTAPCLSDLAEAYEKWRKPAEGGHSHGDESPPNELIESLLSPGGRLHVYPASQEDQRRVAGYTSLGHPYPMRDHGLFVAGILHTLAPEASLHLYEVMNPYGVGCASSLMKALSQTLDNINNNTPILENRTHHPPTLVNCSLVLSISEEGHPTEEYPGEFLDPDLREYMNTPYERIFDSLSRAGVVVVAASGNDAQNGERVAARYPAAFKNVIGVGALPPENPPGTIKKAGYSNLAGELTGAGPGDEKEEVDGYATLGGEKGPGKGVLGIFINPIPVYDGHLPSNKGDVRRDRTHYRYNRTGWVRWAGTSFAAPMITGILARSWKAGTTLNLAAAKAILDDLAEPQTTDEGEKVIWLTQE
jgi:hypothetical protein